MKHRLLIVDGQHIHDWPRQTALLRHILEHTGRFDIAVATASTPATFTVDFDRYDVVLSNYYGPDWPPKTLDKLLEFVRRGGGFVGVHGGSSPFAGHVEFNRMVGLAWRPATAGDRLTVDADGQLRRTPVGQGPGAGHGPCFPYPVIHLQKEHPILRGLPEIWMHAKDELWHGLRGPAENLTVLATAFSPRTRACEPVMWTVGYGEGRVFITVLGHLWPGGEAIALGCVGFRDTLARGCQWAATGTVTLPIPTNFPTEGEISLGEVKYP